MGLFSSPYSSDIDEQILSALQVIFQKELITAIPGDPLALRVLKQADLQDDPTQTAPYLVYKPYGDETQGIHLPDHAEQQMYGSAEIGGPVRFLYKYQCTFGCPLAISRNLARAQIAILKSRIMMTLMYYYDLSNVLSSGALMSADKSKYIEGQNNRLILTAGDRIYGGEQTFYGTGTVTWQYPVSWDIPVKYG